MIIQKISSSAFPIWDNFIHNSRQGDIFMTTSWLDITTKGHFSIYLVYDKDEPIAGCCIPLGRWNVARMPMLTSSCGIVWSDKIDGLRGYSKQKKIIKLLWETISLEVNGIELSFHRNFDYWLPFIWLNAKINPRQTYEIDFNTWDNDITSIRNKWYRYRIRKMNKEDYLLKGGNINDVIELSKQTYIRQNKKMPYSNEILLKLHKWVQREDRGEIVKIVDKDGRLHAVAYFLFWGNEVCYWISASGELGRNSGAHFYLIWKALERYNGRFETFHFEGSMIENIESSFRKFNAKPRNYFHIVLYNSWSRYYLFHFLSRLKMKLPF